MKTPHVGNATHPPATWPARCGRGALPGVLSDHLASCARVRLGCIRPACASVLSRAVFVDRGGVLTEDVHLLTERARIRLLDGVPQALVRLHEAGFALIVISNETVVSRGLADGQDVSKSNHREWKY